MEVEKVVVQRNTEPLELVSGRGDEVQADKYSERENKEKERLAIQRAKDRARTARWDLNIAIFLFAVLLNE